jgi:Domain of unknown function (DUF4055)
MYFEAVGRTIDGFVGAIARKPPKIIVPSAIDDILKDASADGTSLGELLKRGAKETFLQGRSGIMVDWDEAAGRPYITLYTTESIVNWWDGGVVLHETVYEADPEDKFRRVAVEQYRELELLNGVYTVNIWRKSTSATSPENEWFIATTTTPTKRGVVLDSLPFYWLTCMGKTNAIERPPLMGLVNISISHYRSSADLEHGRHFAGLPTLYVTGSTDADAPIKIGAQAAIVLTDAQAKVGYAEFTGQGLSSLERALEHKEAQMAALGAAVFGAAQRKGVEAAETARIRISGENSLLISVCEAIEESLTAALQCAANWLGATGEVSIKINREFIGNSIEPQALQALVAAFQAGAYSLDSFLFALQRSDFIPPDVDLTEEAKKTIAEAAVRSANETALAVKVKSASGNTAAV